ncbi:hypothetical protein JOL62DRAFT_616472 [Phyllosticta paracitricarpa]|uniref:Uncharacterized protein n=1 Tax=Phyllosticta paracitricarpa TaxID=2016321 RepID=A0ABR1MT44_9PEZI
MPPRLLSLSLRPPHSLAPTATTRTHLRFLLHRSSLPAAAVVHDYQRSFSQTAPRAIGKKAARKAAAAAKKEARAAKKLEREQKAAEAEFEAVTNGNLGEGEEVAADEGEGKGEKAATDEGGIAATDTTDTAKTPMSWTIRKIPSASKSKMEALKSPQTPNAPGIYRGDRQILSFPSWRKVAAYSSLVVLGLLAANQLIEFLFPKTAKAESEEEQRARLEETAQRLNELPVVKALRVEEGWVEIGRVEGQQLKEVGDKKGKKKEETTAAGLVAQQLAASTHLLGPRRVWWNELRGEGISVGWAGPGVTGWPTVVHGGAIAAVMVEAVELGWERQWEKARLDDSKAASSSSPSNIPPSPRIQPLQLDLTYLAPTRSNEFYALRFRASPPPVPAERGAETDLPPQKDMTKREADVESQQPPLAPPESEEWTATLEKVHDGTVCVKARVVMPNHVTTTVGLDGVGPVSVEKSKWRFWA